MPFIRGHRRRAPQRELIKQFMSSPIAVDGAFSIYSRDLNNYRRDSQRSLRDRWNRKYGHIKTMWNSFTIWTPLLAVTLLSTHSIYA